MPQTLICQRLQDGDFVTEQKEGRAYDSSFKGKVTEHPVVLPWSVVDCVLVAKERDRCM